MICLMRRMGRMVKWQTMILLMRRMDRIRET